MPKIILEQRDFEALIQTKYPGAEIIGDALLDIEVPIRIKDYVPAPHNSPQPQEYVRTQEGFIDAKASGLTLENRERTIPGKAMGRERGKLPTF